MTEEEIKALQDAKDEAERRASVAEEAAQAARTEADKAKGDVTKVEGVEKEGVVAPDEAIDTEKKGGNKEEKKAPAVKA